MTKGILYYTSNTIDGITNPYNNKPIFGWVQERLKEIGLPIVSVSLKPMDFGHNIVLHETPSIVTMTKQILTGLKAMNTDITFLCEHDILYNPTHFEINPEDYDTFYYNENTWKWDVGTSRVVWHSNGAGLHCMCGYTKKLIEYYEKKMAHIIEKGYDKLPITRNPKWARSIGYEPGKPIIHGGITDDKQVVWMSSKPIINIRHKRTVTPRKMEMVDFIRKPVEWKESTIDKII